MSMLAVNKFHMILAYAKYQLLDIWIWTPCISCVSTFCYQTYPWFKNHNLHNNYSIVMLRTRAIMSNTIKGTCNAIVIKVTRKFSRWYPIRLFRSKLFQGLLGIIHFWMGLWTSTFKCVVSPRFAIPKQQVFQCYPISTEKILCFLQSLQSNP